MKPYNKITIIYFILGSLWVFFSDRVITFLAADPNMLTYLQTVKGWFFILFTSGLLYVLIRNSYNKIIEREKENETIFRTTMDAVQHILNNFLYKMMFYKVTAVENNNDDVVNQYTKVIDETTKQILRLGEIPNISAEEIEKSAYPEKFN